MAKYIKKSSVFKRKLIYGKLQKTSFLSRIYLSFQFHSFKETAFPRRLIFKGRSILDGDLQMNAHRRHHVIAVGTNRFFNLGVISDGSPVEEPHLVNVPQVIKIEMSNSHTVFLTANNRIFGCGKAAAFLPDRIEESEGGYVALPLEIHIANAGKHAKINDIRVSEGGSQFQIEDDWYFVGKNPHSSAKTRKISSNCLVSSEPFDNPDVNFQVGNIPIDGSHVKIFLTLDNNCLYWDRSPQFPAKKEVALIVNGSPICAEFTQFQVLNDGTIYAANNCLLKGRLEFWKNLDDGFIVKNGTVMEHFDTKYTLIALMEEVSGSIGTEFFSVSPDGHNLIMKMGYRDEFARRNRYYERHIYQSRCSHLIFKNREEQGDFLDIPKDLTLVFNTFTSNEEDSTNRVIFETMFPELQYRIKNDSVHVNTFGSIGPEYLDLRQYACENNLCTLPTRSEDSSQEFVPEGTDPSMIWSLLTSDGQRVACHKYFLLLHSRQIGAMQSFNSTVYGGYQFEESDLDPIEVKTNATEATVRNALRGMFNTKSLFEIKTIELIECINFYDYHLMTELFDDAFHILMETVTDFSLPFLYELFWSYEEKVIEGFVERPHLLFNSISSIYPPKELLFQLANKMEKCEFNSTERAGSLINYDCEDIVNYFMNVDEDSDEKVWSMILEEYDFNVQSMRETIGKKEKVKIQRSRNNSNTLECHQQSSPITIRNRNKSDSFSKSVESPIQSPSGSFSMCSMTKALPIKSGKQRNDSVSSSIDNFPELSPSTCSFSTYSKAKSPGGRFAPKGARFVNADQMLKRSAPANPWKKMSSFVSPTTSKFQENEEEEEESTNKSVRFEEILQKEEKLQRNIRTGFKKVQLLAHVETEQLAGAQLLEVLQNEYRNEALVRVELVLTDDLDVDDEQIVWGNMPGLIRR
uniref:Uncharacterized protein n=1 Tax=Caenorhabditis japonica TaxID=281687 RepID=A0A8R1DFD6_CAEJA